MCCLHIWMKIQGKESTIKLLMSTKVSTIKINVDHTKFPPTLIRQNNVVPSF